MNSVLFRACADERGANARSPSHQALGMVGAELRACQESLDAEKARNAALEEQVASLEHESQSKSDEIVQLRAQVRDAIDASAGHSNELSRARMEHTSSQREIDARGAETTRLREELEALRSQLIAKAEALEVQKRSIDTIRKSAEEVASFEAEEISRLETENRLLREHVERANRPVVDGFTPASLAAGTEQLTSGGGPDVVRELSERCDWLQQQNSQLGSTLALVAQCQTDTANALLQQRSPEPDAMPQNEPALVRSHSVLASSPGPAQELQQLQQLLGRASHAAGPGSNGAAAAIPAQPPLLVSHPAMAPAPGGTEKELHQLHSLLSQTYRVGTSAQDPAVDECIRLSLKLADDILSETTNGTTPNGETLPPTSAGTVSTVPVHRAGDEARLLDSLFSLYSSSAAFKPPGG